LCQCWPFPWRKRDFHQRPSLSSRHPPPSSSSLSSSFTASKHNLASFWTTSWSLPSAVQSLTTGLCPGTQQLTYFRRLSTKSLVALVSVCVIVSKIRPFYAPTKFYLDVSFF
jgi:hypothetical protein